MAKINIAPPPDRVVITLTTLKDKVLKVATYQVAGLLAENIDDIWQDIQAAATAHAEETSGDDKPKPFQFSLSAAIGLVQKQGDFEVATKLSWSVKHQDSTEPKLVSDQPDMFE